MVEFALWSVAMSYDDGPLPNTVLRKSDEETLYTLKLAQGGPLEMPSGVREFVESTPAADGPGSEDKTFAKVCSRLGVAKTTLITWRVLSAQCHPVAAIAYLSTELRPGGVWVRKELTIPGVGVENLVAEVLSLAVLCLIWAGLAFDRLLGDHPLYPELSVIATEAHVDDLTY